LLLAEQQGCWPGCCPASSIRRSRAAARRSAAGSAGWH